MFFKKKKMIDIAELQRRGRIRMPKGDVEVETNKEGFVEVDAKKDAPISFFENPSQNASGFSTEQDGYSKREVDARIEALDNKVYKLEQRIELLERKAGVNQPVSGIGW